MKEKIKEILDFLRIANNLETSAHIEKDCVPVLVEVLNDYLRYHNSFCLPEDEKKFKEIEKALGFDLFIWQKTFITMGVMRQTGETTARCLRDLVFRDSAVDFSRPPSSQKERCERYSMMQISEKLNNAGVSTNPILRSMRDLKKYQNRETATIKPIEEIKPIWKV